MPLARPALGARHRDDSYRGPCSDKACDPVGGSQRAADGHKLDARVDWLLSGRILSSSPILPGAHHSGMQPLTLAPLPSFQQPVLGSCTGRTSSLLLRCQLAVTGRSWGTRGSHPQSLCPAFSLVNSHFSPHLTDVRFWGLQRVTLRSRAVQTAAVTERSVEGGLGSGSCSRSFAQGS
jgi:hypothetical protein